MSELHAHHLFCQLLSAIEYIHYKNICHCDLKTANILISNIGVKLIDFGLSRYFQEDLLFHKVYGTPNYMSPEIYLNTPEPGYDGVKADIWACGIILYIMITREKPFNGDDILELRNNILNHQYTSISTVSDDLNDLLSKMFIKDPNERISLSQIKHHKWIVSNRTDSDDNKVSTVSTPTTINSKNNKENNDKKDDDEDIPIQVKLRLDSKENEDDDNMPLNRSSSITLALTKSLSSPTRRLKQQKQQQHIPSIPPLYPNNPLFQSEPDINNNELNIPMNGNAVSVYEYLAEQNELKEEEEEEEDDNDENDLFSNNESIKNHKHIRHYSLHSLSVTSLHSAKTTPSFKPRSLSNALINNTSPYLTSFSLLPPPAINNNNSNSSNTSLILPLSINASTSSLNSPFPLPSSNTTGSNSNTTPNGQYSIYKQQSPFLQPIPVLPHTYSMSLDDDYGEEEEECDLDAIWQFRG